MAKEKHDALTWHVETELRQWLAKKGFTGQELEDAIDTLLANITGGKSFREKPDAEDK